MLIPPPLIFDVNPAYFFVVLESQVLCRCSAQDISPKAAHVLTSPRNRYAQASTAVSEEAAIDCECLFHFCLPEEYIPPLGWSKFRRDLSLFFRSM